MNLPVDVPIVGAQISSIRTLLILAQSAGVGFVAVVVVTAPLLLVLRWLKIGEAARIGAMVAGVVLLVVSVWIWLSWPSFSWIRVTEQGVELRYLEWPRPAHLIPFDQIKSVRLSSERSRKRRYTHHLVVTTTPDASGRSVWRSDAGKREHIELALQWIAHASGGRLAPRDSELNQMPRNREQAPRDREQGRGQPRARR